MVYTGNILWGPAEHLLLITRAVCSRAVLHVGHTVLHRATTVGTQIDIANKMYNLEKKIDKLPGTYNLLRLNQERIGTI